VKYLKKKYHSIKSVFEIMRIIIVSVIFINKMNNFCDLTSLKISLISNLFII